MMVLGVALMLLGMCGIWFDDWKGYALAYCMAFGVVITAISAAAKIIELVW